MTKTEITFSFHNSDCLEFMEDMKDDSIDLIVTDPPYIINLGKNGTSKLYHKKTSIYASEALKKIANGFNITQTLNQFKRICKKANFFIFCSNQQIYDLFRWSKQNNMIATVLVWYKTNAMPFAGNSWRPNIEYIIHVKEKGAFLHGNSKELSKVWVGGTNPSRYGHPTEKPLKLILNLVKVGSREGDTVFDPFLGSGTTAEACFHLKRNFVGCELEKAYFNTSVQRVKDASAQLSLFGGEAIINS